jgi:hypothetical protein
MKTYVCYWLKSKWVNVMSLEGFNFMDIYSNNGINY